jgi:hypothetical protein
VIGCRASQVDRRGGDRRRRPAARDAGDRPGLRDLTYGGVSLFVVVFAAYPFAAEMFRQTASRSG